MRWKFILGLLTTCAVLMSMSYTMLIPFLPMYLIQDLGGGKADVDMWSGAIFAITFLVSGIMAPIWGALADKKSRKLMALRAGFCLAITYFLGGLVTNPWELLGVRFIQGLSAGLWPALLAATLLLPGQTHPESSETGPSLSVWPLASLPCSPPLEPPRQS